MATNPHKPTTRQEFQEYCLRRLGAPVLKVNIAPEQMEDRINDALFMYHEKHMDGTEEKWMVIPIDDAIVANGYFTLPEAVWGVADARVANNANASGDILANVTYQIQLSDYLNTATGSFAQNFDVVNYYFTQYQIANMNFVLSPQHQFKFNKRTHRLWMQGIDLSLLKEDGTPIVLKVYINPYTEEQEYGDDEAELWADEWLCKYATALIRQQWAEHLSKFKDIPLPGGISLNGADMMAKAEKEIEDCIDELENKYQEPIDFFMG
jgi:hypothetical protein